MRKLFAGLIAIVCVLALAGGSAFLVRRCYGGDKITEINAEIEALKEENRELNDRISVIEALIAAFEYRDYSDLLGIIETLQTEIEALKDRVTELDDFLAGIELGGEVAGFGELLSQIQRLEDKVAELEKLMSEYKTLIAKYEGKLQYLKDLLENKTGGGSHSVIFTQNGVIIDKLTVQNGEKMSGLPGFGRPLDDNHYWLLNGAVVNPLALTITGDIVLELIEACSKQISEQPRMALDNRFIGVLIDFDFYGGGTAYIVLSDGMIVRVDKTAADSKDASTYTFTSSRGQVETFTTSNSVSVYIRNGVFRAYGVDEDYTAVTIMQFNTAAKTVFFYGDLSGSVYGVEAARVYSLTD